MHNCEKYQEQLSAYADGMLTPSETAELEAHLSVCPACRTLLDIFKTLSDEADGLCMEPPADLTAAVMAQIHSGAAAAPRSVKKSGKRIWLRALVPAACFVLIIGAVWQLGLPGSGRSDMGSAKSQLYDYAAADYASEACAPAEAPENFAADYAAPAADAADDSVFDAPAAEEDSKESAVGASPARSGYFAVITLTGEIPDVLAAYDFRDGEAGTRIAEIPSDVAESLADAGITVDVLNPDAETAQIIVYPE